MTDRIDRLVAAEFDAHVPALAALLVDAVDDGASLGFLSGLGEHEAAAWWRAKSGAVADGSVAVWVARTASGVSGTVSLVHPDKPNARHRAELVKLAVHRSHRGRGLGRRLLQTAEQAAADSGVTLLILDTETASTAETLYASAGWQRYGIVPDYAADPAGILRDCSFFYKKIKI
jgi:GNAT superfamily N-acetyltransferase